MNALEPGTYHTLEAMRGNRKAFGPILRTILLAREQQRLAPKKLHRECAIKLCTHGDCKICLAAVGPCGPRYQKNMGHLQFAQWAYLQAAQ